MYIFIYICVCLLEYKIQITARDTANYAPAENLLNKTTKIYWIPGFNLKFAAFCRQILSLWEGINPESKA